MNAHPFTGANASSKVGRTQNMNLQDRLKKKYGCRFVIPETKHTCSILIGKISLKERMELWSTRDILYYIAWFDTKSRQIEAQIVLTKLQAQNLARRLDKMLKENSKK